MNNTLMMYDSRCKATIDKSGYDIHPMQIVKNADELINIAEKITSDKILYKELLSTQQSNVSKIIKEKNDTLLKIKNVING